MTRILHISDPHFDFDRDGVRQAVQQVLHRGDFDVIACSGDIANDELDCAEFLGWFTDIRVPKFLVPGNHDLWWTRRPRTALGRDLNRAMDGFWGHARRAGWITPKLGVPWEVVDNVLLFNVFYTPTPSWDSLPAYRYSHGQGPNDLNYSADRRNMYRFDDLVLDPHVPQFADPLAWSMSHLSPSDQVPSQHPPQVCFVNNAILRLAQVHKSPLHIFGHTHEACDYTLGGTRFVNRTWMNDEYRLEMPPIGVIIELEEP